MNKELKYMLENYILSKDVLNLRLDPSDFFLLNKYAPIQMSKILNGCKPSYFPKKLNLNVNKCIESACNYHDFDTWINYNHSETHKQFKRKMKKCKGFKSWLAENTYYFLVKMFGGKSFSNEEKTYKDFFDL